MIIDHDPQFAVKAAWFSYFERRLLHKKYLP